MSDSTSDAALVPTAVTPDSSAAQQPTLPPAPTAHSTDANADAEYVVLPNGHKRYRKGQDPRLRYQKPYWWPYKTFVKDRWIGRELLEVVSTEFRDRSVEYYVRYVCPQGSAALHVGPGNLGAGWERDADAYLPAVY